MILTALNRHIFVQKKKKRSRCSNKILLSMKLIILMLFTATMQVSANTFAQTVSFTGKKVSIESVFESIETQSNYVFFYNAEALKNAQPVSINLKNVSIETLLQESFKSQPVRYYVKDHTVFIVRKDEKVSSAEREAIALRAIQQRIVKGNVVDEEGNALNGVTITVKGTSKGTVSDKDGNYSLQLTDSENVLIFSFVGMTSQEIVVGNQSTIKITLTYASVSADDVVVTGFFTKNKSSYTGSAVTFTGAELKAISPTSILSALSTVTPGLIMVEEKTQGSNPNRVPEILVRGVTSFSAEGQSVNQPLIVRDGTIISMQDLYDMDINEIESITVLKDASAAALYGAKAANGVIVIERMKIQSGRMKVAYNATGSIQFPDFSDYRILNASQKLEYEGLAGLYTAGINSGQPVLDSLYNERLKEVNRGVNTDWMKQPSRVGYSLNHSLRLSGGSDNSRFELNARYGNVEGVMKDDYRKRYGIGFALEYYAPQGLSFTNRTNYSQVNTKNTPFGVFSQYTRLNPYDRMHDAFGEYNKTLSWNMENPLYEATIGSYDEKTAQVFSNDFDARWNINNEFRITSHWNLTLNNGAREKYESPLAKRFETLTDPSLKGAMTEVNDKGVSYSGNVVVSYNKLLEKNSLFTANLGGTINRNDLKNSGFTGIGFYSEELKSMGFAAGYPAGTYPIGGQDLSTDVGGFLNINYMLNNRYYLDGVYQISGSSKFGANNRYGHFWSTGVGWNIHNESFVNSDWIDILKLRGSVGYTGKVSFDSFQAMTTYQFNNTLLYLNGIGAVPITIGNPDLKWERTMNYNVGLDLSFLNRRFNLTADVYKRKTTDLLIDKAIAPSAGIITGKDNLGEMENKGIELHIDAYVIKNNNLFWQLGTNISHNKNKILKISDALKKLNEENNQQNTIAPLPQFIEGQSTTALKVVQSGGIDPATGREVYIKLNGEKTFEYNPDDKIVVGDLLPKATGSVFSVVSFNRITAAAYFGFNYGGYVYNTTRATKVEGSSPIYNADERVFNDRWKNPGDISIYKDIADRSTPRQTTRFVEKENTLSLSRLNISYELNQPFIKNLGINKFSFGVSMNEVFRLSTVKIERGTDYLYSRGIDLNLNILF